MLCSGKQLSIASYGVSYLVHLPRSASFYDPRVTSKNALPRFYSLNAQVATCSTDLSIVFMRLKLEENK